MFPCQIYAEGIYKQHVQRRMQIFLHPSLYQKHMKLPDFTL